MKDNKIFETHAHYDDEAFDSDRNELLLSLPEEGISTVINVAASLEGVDRTYELTTKYDHVYGAIGIHPSDVADLNENNFQHLREVALRPKILAVGEIGLDYHYEDCDRSLQQEWFERQLVLARDINKPVIIHSRDACEDTMKILRDRSYSSLTGVVHCYSYSVETARELLKMGYYLGIGGVITFSNARKLVETVEETPLDRILLETDSPYLAPTPYRGKRNSSLFLPLVAEKIAAIKGVSYSKVVDQTYKNARKLFFNK